MLADMGLMHESRFTPRVGLETMITILRTFFSALFLIVPTAAISADEATLKAGRVMSDAFLSGDTGKIWNQMTPDMQKAMGSEAKLTEFRDGIDKQLGKSEIIISETTFANGALRVYDRVSERPAQRQRLQAQWAFDSAGKVAGFFVKPAPKPAESRFLDYQTKADLRLPFRGNWFVFWGGRTLEHNYHAADPGQRFAADLVVVKDGSSHRGSGQALEDYYCWDQPIFAPADGKIVSIENGLPDLTPGTMDPENPAGNHVVIDLGAGEFAFLAHLRQGSIGVKAGETIKHGAEIGSCGNSGNTSEPHLHFHLQTGSKLGEGEGLPAFFNEFVADGQPVDRGEPRRGQTISAE